jgi:streptogramin lyase
MLKPSMLLLAGVVVGIAAAGCFDPASRGGRTDGCFPACPIAQTCDAGHCVSRITEFITAPVPDAASYQPLAIVAGPDGSLWFTQESIDRIGRLTPAGAYTSFETPVHDVDLGGPWGITIGPEGAVWFTLGAYGSVARLNPDGPVTELPAALPGSATGDIVLGPDGKLWFTMDAGAIGRVEPDHTITTFLVGEGTVPVGLTAGPDGNVWFTQTGAQRIGRITPAGKMDHFQLEPDASVFGITAGPDGALWFPQSNGSIGSMGRITTSGQLTRYELPNSVEPRWIVVGPDGHLWFTDVGSRAVGRMKLNGEVAWFQLPSSSHTPLGITSGPDGNIWFTEVPGRVARLVLPEPSL